MMRWKPAVATLTLALLFATTLGAQQPGFKRHTHPGEEIGYVLEGTLTLMVDGKPPLTVKQGESFFVPAGTIHDGKAEGAVKVLATYVVEKGKPLATPAQ